MSREIYFSGGHADGKRITRSETFFDKIDAKLPRWNGPRVEQYLEDVYVFSGRYLPDGAEIWTLALPESSPAPLSRGLDI